ncbi:MAG: HEAT repeat domain-containing protein, partial [Planctomycetota bacterium]
MRKHMPQVLLVGVMACLLAFPAGAGEREPIEVLRSDAPYKAKQRACRTLSRHGGSDSVPALARLLDDEKLSHMARYALERIPGPEADRALREKLDETSGDIRAGIIKSLEVRGDRKAIPQLIGLLDAENQVVSGAAARALGRFATPEATAALEDAIGRADLSEEQIHAFADGLLSCAESFAEQGDSDRAVALYEKLLEHPDAPQPVHTAALRGVALNRGGIDGLQPVLDALHAENERMFGAAIRAVREMGSGDEVSEALTDELTDLSEIRQVRLIQALGERRDMVAGPALMELAQKGSVDVRVAAIRALTRIGYEDALDMVQTFAWRGEGKLAEAARDSLAYFPASAADEALEGMLDHQSVEARGVAVSLIRQGGLPDPAPVLMQVAETDKSREVRLAALKAVRSVAGP